MIGGFGGGPGSTAGCGRITAIGYVRPGLDSRPETYAPRQSGLDASRAIADARADGDQCVIDACECHELQTSPDGGVAEPKRVLPRVSSACEAGGGQVPNMTPTCPPLSEELKSWQSRDKLHDAAESDHGAPGLTSTCSRRPHVRRWCCCC